MIQRVKSASVTVDGQLISTISKGILVFAAVAKDDTTREVESLATKLLKVKLWEDEETGVKWKRNVQEIEGEVLCGNEHSSVSLINPNSPSTLLLKHTSYLLTTNQSSVSQFTLLATTRKGNKPDFHKSAPAAQGKELYDSFVGRLRSLYREDRVKDGVFRAMMDVGLVNDGPVGVDYRCEDEVVNFYPIFFYFA